MPTLILTPRFTPDSQALWRAAGQLGWDVERLVNWRVPEDLRHVAEPVLYVEALTAPMLAESFGLRLVEPPNDWLTNLPWEHRRRDMELTTLGAARSITQPAFMKPPNDKSFPAAIQVGAVLPDLPTDTLVLVAEVVAWEKEFRFFILDREPLARSIYLRHGEPQRDHDFAAEAGELDDAEAYVRRMLADKRIELPRATVVDVGVIAGRGWAVVEQNAAWGSGIYGCDPKMVLTVLRHAAVPSTDLDECPV